MRIILKFALQTCREVRGWFFMALTMYTEGVENMTGQINTGNIQGLLTTKKRKQQQQQNPFLVQ